MEHAERFTKHSERQQGFTLAEVVVVLAVITILSAIAAPSFIQWVQNAEYRASARAILYVFRETRSRAITTNFEHRVEFENVNRRYRVMKGNKSSHSNKWNTVVCDWSVLPPMVRLYANVEKIQLNPTGSANPGTIRIQDASANTKYEIRIANTGRARIPSM